MGRALVIFGILACCTGGFAMQSGDAYLKREGDRWTFGTATIARVVALEDGKLLPKSFRAGVTGRELASPGAGAAEFAVEVGEDRTLVTSASGGWKLVDAVAKKLALGELQLDLVVQREGLRVTKSYVVYPQS
ncbi:MAG: hypothetical protein WCP21_12225, partial [Armatimonadota bacterium]